MQPATGDCWSLRSELQIPDQSDGPGLTCGRSRKAESQGCDLAFTPAAVDCLALQVAVGWKHMSTKTPASNPVQLGTSRLEGHKTRSW